MNLSKYKNKKFYQEFHIYNIKDNFFDFQNFSQIKVHVLLIVDEYILYYNVNQIVEYCHLSLQAHTWSFVPTAEEKYLMKPCLIVWGQGFHSSSSGGKKKQFSVRAIGEGSIGDIKVRDSDTIKISNTKNISQLKRPGLLK